MRRRGPSDPLNRHRRRFGEGCRRERDRSMNMNSGDQSDAAPVQEIGSFDVRHLSEQQLAALGVSRIAYVKPVMVNGVQGFAIHAADGTPMAVAGDRDVAVAAVMQHEMLPVSVH
jgi:hypothetical protein